MVHDIKYLLIAALSVVLMDDIEILKIMFTLTIIY